MTEINQTNQPGKRPFNRNILLLFALLTAPFLCCGCNFFLDALPATLLPPAVDFVVNIFEAEARIENRSEETLYLTPFTTTYGRPMVIPQDTSLRQRDFPLRPQQSIVLTYDAADLPLSGIAVCRADGDCRLLATDSSAVYSIDSFEALPVLEPDWLSAINAHSQYRFGTLLMLMFSFIPVVFFLGWLYLGRQKSKGMG